MTTTLSIDSSELSLDPAGANPVFGYYLLYYGPPNSSTQINATLQELDGTASQQIVLNGAYESAKLYFLIGTQSLGTVGATTVSQSTISWADAQTRDYRYDSFEFTLSNQSGDQGNLTSVNNFGIPIGVDIPGVGTRGYNVSGNTIFSTLNGLEPDTVSTYGAGTGLAGQNRMILSPASALGAGLPGYAATDWAGYVDSLKTTASQMIVTGYFNGASDGPPGTGVYHNPGYLSYQLSWDGTDFWLKPTASSQIKGDLKISPTDLQNSIYSTLGTAYVYSPDGTPYRIDGSSSAMNTGANTQWGEVFTRFLSAFSAGYWGSTGSINGSTISGVDLSKSWNQDPAYAYGGLGIYTASAAPFYDQYAKVFWQNSNSYGTGYSDALTAAFAQGSPLISLWNGTSNVSTINLALHSDTYIPPAPPAGDYIIPTIYDYIPAPYAAPAPTTDLSIGVSLSNGPMVLAPQTLVTLQYYDPVSQTFKIASQTTTGTNTANLTFGNVPAAELGTNWYQIVIGTGSMAKAFNLFAKTENQQFVNPRTGFQPDAVQIDGLGVIQAGAYSTQEVTNFNVNLAAGLPSWFLVRNTDPATGAFLTPQAPVVGKMAGGLFDELASPGADNPTVTAAHLAFGWNGADSAAGNNVSAYTNKIGALDVARVVFSGAGAPVPVRGVADIDGNWITKVAHFGNGTYTAVMTEFLPTDMAFQTPVSNPSAPEQFTVSLSDLPINPNGGGNGIIVNPGGGGSGTEGNWLRFDTTQSSLPNATVLLYTTDANGNLVGREGQTGPGVTLDDAVIGKIGWVASDSGAVLFGGHQSVHLLVGLELHFAIVTGDNVIDRSPGVAITGSGALDVNITGTNGSIQMTARVDNTLSANAALASSQREDDHAWVYLDQGATIHVDSAGSAANVNTLHFVRIDVNPTTEAWGVGGVAYGNTDAFRAAVQANWDSGFVQQNGGGTFHNSQNWTVAGADGYYAPVLVTQSGDIFVIGTGNIDGQHHIRNYGENVFGFEDLRADQHSDFDYNDMVMRLTVL